MRREKFVGFVSLTALAFVLGCAHAPVQEAYVAQGAQAAADDGWVDSLGVQREVANKGGRKCAERAKKAGCYLSNNDFSRIDSNVETCKHMESSSGKTALEVFLLSDADKIVVLKTKGNGVFGSACPVTKYTVDRSGIVEMKVIGNRLFMNSKDGQVYFMHSDETIYELLNAKGKSYSNVNDIKGGASGNSIILSGPGFQHEMTTEDLNDRVRAGKVRQVEFFRYTTERSLFRDE